MRLIPWEEERLQLFAAAELARRRSRRGPRASTHPEAVALICDAMLEAARAGAGVRRRSRRPGGRRSTRPTCSTGCASCSTRSGSRCSWATARGSSRCVDPLGSRRRRTRSDPGALRDRRPVRRRAQRRAGRRVELDRRRAGRGGGSGSRRTTRSTGSTRVSRSTARPPGASTLTSRPAPMPAGSRARRRPCAWSATPGRTPATARAGDPPLRGGVPGEVRLRRPATASGSATPTCGSASADDLTASRRRTGLGLREEPPEPDRPVGRGERTVEVDVVLTGALVVDPVSASSRRTSASRTAGSPGSGVPGARGS